MNGGGHRAAGSSGWTSTATGTAATPCGRATPGPRRWCPSCRCGAGLVYTYTKPKRDDMTDAWYLTALDFDTGQDRLPPPGRQRVRLQQQLRARDPRAGRHRLRRRAGRGDDVQGRRPAEPQLRARSSSSEASSPSASSATPGTAPGSVQKPKPIRPASETAEARRACRSAGSASEYSSATRPPSTATGSRGPGTLETESANSLGPDASSRCDPIQRSDVREAVEEGVELVGVVVLLSAAGLGVDRRQALAGVGLRDRQVAEQERVAVAELVGVLASVMHADRDLDAHRLRRLVVGPQPAPDRAGDDGEQDVVDRHAAAGRVLDPLQVVQLAGGEGDLAVAADPTIERRVGAQRPELASQGRGESGQLTAALAPAARGGGRAGAARQRAADAAQPAARAGGEQARRAGGGLGVPRAQARGSSPSSESHSSWESIRRQVTPSARQWWMRITSAVRPSESRAGDAYRPERSRVIEALGHRLSDQLHQLGAVAHRRGQRDGRGCGCRTPSRRPRPGRRAARGSPPGAAGRVAGPQAAPRLGCARARPSAAGRPAPARRSPASGCGRLSRRIRAAGCGCRRRSVAPSDSSLPDGAAARPRLPHGYDFLRLWTYKVSAPRSVPSASSCSRRHHRCVLPPPPPPELSPAGSSPSALSPLGRSAYHSAPN